MGCVVAVVIALLIAWDVVLWLVASWAVDDGLNVPDGTVNFFVKLVVFAILGGLTSIAYRSGKGGTN